MLKEEHNLTRKGDDILTWIITMWEEFKMEGKL